MSLGAKTRDISYKIAQIIKKYRKKFCPILDTHVSGSPIIQDGKLIGAVTHVLIDNPKKGFGIFAKTMLETAQGVANEEIKEVS